MFLINLEFDIFGEKTSLGSTNKLLTDFLRVSVCILCVLFFVFFFFVCLLKIQIHLPIHSKYIFRTWETPTLLKVHNQSNNYFGKRLSSCLNSFWNATQTNYLMDRSGAVSFIPVILLNIIADYPSANSSIFVGSPWVPFAAIVVFANLKS